LEENEIKPGPMTDIMNILYGGGIPEGEGLKKKVLAFICLQRPLIAIMGPFMFFAAAVLAINTIPPLEDLIFGFIAVYLLSAAEHSIDDTIDKKIDRVKWPTRPLPTESLKRSTGGLFAISLAALGVSISFIFFNWQLVVVELVALGLGTLYPFLRNKFGYLILAPIPPLIGIGGWVAYSPETLLSSQVPWIIYLVFFFWQAFHILTLPWAINVAKTFIVRPKPKTVVELSVIFSAITLLLMLYLSLFLLRPLLLFLIMIALSVIFWIAMVPLLRDPTNTKLSMKATMVATNYNLVMCLGLILSAI
jgi:4-hydroxybenzoate polyprenyltransferase